MCDAVSEYAKSIVARTENTLMEYKHLRRIRQEYFDDYRKYTDRRKIEPFWADFCPKTKKIHRKLSSNGQTNHFTLLSL
jgi:hypothetical protein